MLMLGHAFNSGAVRVQFTVDVRNERSQAAVAKLGAKKEGILRHDTRTWTGHIRDTVVFSILESEWPAVKLRLEQRLMEYRSEGKVRPIADASVAGPGLAKSGAAARRQLLEAHRPWH